MPRITEKKLVSFYFLESETLSGYKRVIKSNNWAEISDKNEYENRNEAKVYKRRI